MGRLKIYFAPLEGITGYTLRKVHRTCYSGIDWYFTPFISPNQNTLLSTKEKRDVAVWNNVDVPVIPQVLTKRSELFLSAAKELKAEFGYNEINLNLGCPSKTVVSKGRGSGMLADTEALNRFFDEVFSAVEAVSSQSEPGGRENPYPRISVKTRLGMNEAEEFAELLKIYNEYPLSELIIHPRVQKEFYKGTPHIEAFVDAMKTSRHSLCYNGNISKLEDYVRIKQLFPTLDKVMIGRGLIANPELAEEIKAYEKCMEEKKPWMGYQPSMERLREFHMQLLEGYVLQMNTDYNNVLFKMKELWNFMLQRFPTEERYIRRMMKATRLSEYEDLSEKFFEQMKNGKDLECS